ncbi:hypothetical protein M440DRAFT_1108244 [Trichoderma longibrachiatum ATCC 18648]|uniref:Uncharacterized protein n=1 Tax=Trichoderma longibrachiatum ATCC 18648 TaxID=983965 RepID=A0A2T4CEM8_TRILO|nr:hypothetical protein M440DRAFT_1108244 [Trichoderma longibrachiatum ATCC 18648]
MPRATIAASTTVCSRTESQYTIVLFGMDSWVGIITSPFLSLGHPANCAPCMHVEMHVPVGRCRSRRRDARPRQPSSYATLQSENLPRCVITGPSGNKQVQTDKDGHAVVVGQDQGNMKR